VREGAARDLKRITEIKVGSWTDTYGSLLEPQVLRPFLDRRKQLAYLRRAIALPTTTLLVANDPSGLVSGFALAYLEADAEPWLESLHVDGEHRGLGIGTLLMRSLAARLQARGYSSLRLGVIVGNVGAARLYERLGATLTGVEPVSWAPGVSHEVYRWPDLAPLTTSLLSSFSACLM
jgi:ribosomal-protein-alanine N-acetyltransferase